MTLNPSILKDQISQGIINRLEEYYSEQHLHEWDNEGTRQIKVGTDVPEAMKQLAKIIGEAVADEVIEHMINYGQVDTTGIAGNVVVKSTGGIK